MDEADDLLQRALLEPDDAAAVALSVGGLPMSDALTVIFHGRRDLGTIQTYVAHGARGAGMKVGTGDLLRVPVDLDLHDAADRGSAEALYAEQARVLRDAIIAADTVLAVWAEPLADAAGGPVGVDRSIDLPVQLPAYRLLPVALRAPERHLTVVPVCGARALAEGRPPMGIACAQQDIARVYPLSDDPEACLEDFLERAAHHARATAERLNQQEASVQRFLELNADDERAA
jgi:hypothetical protein